jgi:hypothetical protein
MVAANALLAPLTLGLVPRLRLPVVVLEIVAGVLVGPQVLGVVEVDLPVSIVALLGLALLLFLAGLEIDITSCADRCCGSSWNTLGHQCWGRCGSGLGNRMVGREPRPRLVMG